MGKNMSGFIALFSSINTCFVCFDKNCQTRLISLGSTQRFRKVSESYDEKNNYWKRYRVRTAYHKWDHSSTHRTEFTTTPGDHAVTVPRVTELF